MKKKLIYKQSDFQFMLEYCIRTTNLGEKAESILRSIRRQVTITPRQFNALNEIALQASEAEPHQTILRNLKFENEQQTNDLCLSLTGLQNA